MSFVQTDSFLYKTYVEIVKVAANHRFYYDFESFKKSDVPLKSILMSKVYQAYFVWNT